MSLSSGPGLSPAIARRSAGKHVLLADLRPEPADAAATVLSDAGFDSAPPSSTCPSANPSMRLWRRRRRSATSQASSTRRRLSVAAPPQPSCRSICTARAGAEEFGNVVVAGGSCVVIASMSGHRLPSLTAEQDKALATTPADELLALPMLRPDVVTDPLNAYQISKRANSLRVLAEAVRWGKRGARVNTSARESSSRAGERRIERLPRGRLPALH